ncbi:hypothetical protein [Acinetobacter sp. ANC 3791]|uniref:hypothetical protein n=1 Tax=Acinetobacter sp. ANC 3791 TaxID=2529836 RepID=UPI00103E06F4|nr:hypothetical protein [Acinetobacter sp. ANC 3791]TCB83353.1 hypothetical protein E0H90_11530 [Acinetobacter sp. ANC 3791]
MKKLPLSNDQLDSIVIGRLFAEDFAQPVRDDAFFKNKAVSQIESSIKAIGSASSNYEFTIAIAQANAYISAAHDYEFIDLAEKITWIDAVYQAVRKQTVLEA